MIYGGVGSDAFYGERGDDELRGGEGGLGSGQYRSIQDRYYFSAGFGGWGRDTIVDPRPSPDVPRSSNRVSVTNFSQAPITVNLSSSPSRWEVRNADGTSTVNWSNNVVDGASAWSEADDKLYGNDANNFISSTLGADEVQAMGGDDYVYVREDRFQDTPGNDTVDCGPGDDTVIHNEGDTLLNCEVQKLQE